MRILSLTLVLFAAAARLAAVSCTPVSAQLCVGVDDYADVWVNGQCVGTVCNDDFAYIDNTSPNPVQCVSVPVGILDPSGNNYIAVRVRNTNPTEMWGTWALDILCAGGFHAYATSNDSFDFYNDPSGTNPPPLESGLPWYDPAYNPSTPWGVPSTTTGTVYGKRAVDPQTGALLPPRSWTSTASASGTTEVMYFRQGFGITPVPTPVPPNMTLSMASSVCAMQNGASFNITLRVCNTGGMVTTTTQVTLTRDTEVSFCGPYSPSGYSISTSGSVDTLSIPSFPGSSCVDYVICGVDYYIGPSEVGTIRHLTAALSYPGGSDASGLDIPAVNCIVFTPTPSRTFTPSPPPSATFTASPSASPTPACPGETDWFNVSVLGPYPDPRWNDGAFTAFGFFPGSGFGFDLGQVRSVHRVTVWATQANTFDLKHGAVLGGPYAAVPGVAYSATWVPGLSLYRLELNFPAISDRVIFFDVLSGAGAPAELQIFGCPAAPPSPTATPTASPSATVTRTYSPGPSPTVTPTLTPAPTPPPPTPTPPPLVLTPKYPNPSPAKDAVWIPYVISADADVDIRVYDVSGEKILDLGPLFQLRGANERRWDLSNAAGTKVASGIYLCRIVAKSRQGEERTAWVKCAVSR